MSAEIELELAGAEDCELGSLVSWKGSVRLPGGGGPATGTVTLGFRCHGSGAPEHHAVASATVSIPASETGAPAILTGQMQLPAAGPASYCGQHVKVDWFVTLALPGAVLVAVRLVARPPRASPDRSA